MQTAETADGRVHRTAHLGFVRHICSHKHRAVASGIQPVHHRLATFVDVENDDRRALFSHSQRNGFTQSIATTGHDGHLSLESVHWLLPTQRMSKPG